MRDKTFRRLEVTWGILALALFLGGCAPARETGLPVPEPVDPEVLRSRLALETQTDEETGSQVSLGTFKVFENRETQEGRMIELKVSVLHATGANPRPDPLFYLAGGPGQAVAEMWRGFAKSHYREERDIVLVNQRGTGGDNFLQVELGSDDDLQGYLDPAFRAEPYQEALVRLQEEGFDLTQYSTFHAADDLNEVRIALGYDQINLMGGSYGTRASLVYMKRHPETVRGAVLNGVAPIAFRNPLYHAYGAHRALGMVLDECAEDPDCSRAFPDVRAELDAVLERLEKGPADAFVQLRGSPDKVPVKVSRNTFAETLRMMMYSSLNSRSVPLFIHQAFEGNFDPTAQQALQRNRALFTSLAMGMLHCVICAEDIDRIDPAEIEKETGYTFFGDFRVRQQMAICDFWPRSKLPADHGDPVSVEVPVLLISGTIDAVTPPRWGEEAAGHLPNSLHVVAPGGHGVGGECIQGIIDAFMNTGSVAGIDTSCVKDMKLAPFKLK